jgi:hypothetical protein
MISAAMLSSLQKLEQSRRGTDGWKFTHPKWSDQQMKFLQSKGKKIILLAPRRAGKTTALAEKMLMTCLTPKIVNGQEIYPHCVFISQTRASAKSIIWQELKTMCQKRGIAYTSNEVDLKIHMPNGAYIEIQGAGLSDSANSARGRRIGLLCIDEASFLPHLREIVAIWAPTLTDWDGGMVLASSPGKSPTGFFYEADIGENKEHWEHYYFDPEKNPAFKEGHYAAFRAEQLNSLYGGNADHPEFLREWCGKWTHDTSNLLFKYEASRNLEETPHIIDHMTYEYIIGLDIGYLDSTAITVVANHRNQPWCMYVDEFAKAEMRISEIVSTIQLFAEKYRASCTVVDSGGMGKHTHVELQNHAEIGAVVAAYKHNKKMNIELLNNDLYAGRVKVNKSCPMILEAWSKILKSKDGKEEELDYGSPYIIDIGDAALYAHTYTHPSILEKLTPDESFGDPIKDKKYARLEKQRKEMERYGIRDVFGSTFK